jgi:hypothetical protein
MKTPLLRPAIRQLVLLSGTSCLVGWLVGTKLALNASALPKVAKAVSTTPHALPWPCTDSLDAVVAAPKFHRILFENSRVRVLEVTVPPHTREPLHTHRWPSVLYRERYGTGRYYNATGKLEHESTKTPQTSTINPRARWQEPEAPHAVENTDEVADRFVRVELKP